MDPEAAWKELLTRFAGEHWERVLELSEDLEQWLARGGFPPYQVTGVDLGMQWDTAIVQAACRFARKHAAERLRSEGGS